MPEGKYWQRYLLRNDHAFDNIIEEVAIDYALAIEAEPVETPLHKYRLAMAKRILAGRRVEDPVVLAFYRSLKDRAVRNSEFLYEAFKNATPNPSTGWDMPVAGDIPDSMLESGIDAAFSDAVQEAWPTIVEDVLTAEAAAQQDSPSV